MTFEDLKREISNICLLLGDHPIFKAMVSIRAFELLDEKISQLTTPEDDVFYSLFDATPDIFLSSIKELSDDFSSQPSLANSSESDFLSGKICLKSSEDGSTQVLAYENNGRCLTLAHLEQDLTDEPFIKISRNGAAFAEAFVEGLEQSRSIRPPFSHGKRVYLGDDSAHSVFSNIAKAMCGVDLSLGEIPLIQ